MHGTLSHLSLNLGMLFGYPALWLRTVGQRVLWILSRYYRLHLVGFKDLTVKLRRCGNQLHSYFLQFPPKRVPVRLARYTLCFENWHPGLGLFPLSFRGRSKRWASLIDCTSITYPFFDWSNYLPVVMVPSNWIWKSALASPGKAVED